MKKDFNQIAKSVVDIAVGEDKNPKTTAFTKEFWDDVKRINEEQEAIFRSFPTVVLSRSAS